MKNVEENNYYIYILLNPYKQGVFKYEDLIFNYEPYYVGRGKHRDSVKYKRIYEHYKKNSEKSYKKNLQKHNIINSIKNDNIEYKFLILYDNLKIEESNLLETDIISKIGRYFLNKGPLTNLAKGGEGIVGSGWSEERKLKFSESTKGINNNFYGKHHSIESKKVMSDRCSTKREEIKVKLRKPKKFKNGNPRKYGNRPDLSNESKNSISIKLSKRINQYDIDGIFIKEWLSSKIANEELKIRRMSIIDCCKGRREEAGGFKWQYA